MFKPLFEKLNHPKESKPPIYQSLNFEEIKALYNYASTHPEKEKIQFGLKFNPGAIGTQIIVVDVVSPPGKGWTWSNKETDISDYSCW